MQHRREISVGRCWAKTRQQCVTSERISALHWTLISMTCDAREQRANCSIIARSSRS